MKKIGLFKRIGLIATTAFVCLAMMITCFAFSAPKTVRADEPTEPTAPTTSAADKLVENLSVKDGYDYGDEIEVPAGAEVIAPDGKKVTDITGNKFKATQLGVYKVKYTGAGGVSYSFNVKVKLAEDYFLFIDHNGAAIPTYIGNDTEFTLPDASIKYYDKDNILRSLPTDKYTVEIEDSLGKTYATTKNATDTGYTTATKFDTKIQTRKVFITYTARLENNGTKYFTKTFTVNIQSKVNKGGNPTIAVSGVPKDASVNRPVTLPVAKATDKNDDNILVEIKVFEPDGKTEVKNVKVNDDGYAYETIDNDPVVFDNDKSMTFYPTKEGKYKVTYTAYNDFGGKSGTTEGTIEVADHVAPVFKNVENYEYLIPETWGATVKDENGKSNPMQNKIKFVIPELVDNKDHVGVPGGEDKNLISLYFRITDADNSKTVLTIPNVFATDVDGKFDKNDVYTEDATFNNDDKSFTFDFSKYEKKNSKGEKMSKSGTYTVLWRARDKANNTSSKSYTVTLKDTFEDSAKPSAAEVTAPDYLSAADETFTVPYPVYADAADSRPMLVYRLYTDAENYIDVKGGEEASLTEKAGYLVIDADKDSKKELKLGDKLYFYVGVTDKAGNFRSNAVADDKSFVDVVANPAEFAKITAATQIIGAAKDDEAFSVDVSGIKFVNGKAGSTEATPIYSGDNVNAGMFVITVANESMRNYTGFEVAVYDPQGTFVDVTLETVSTVDGGVAKIYVKDIRFNAAISTEKTEDNDDPAYTMTIRVFDVNGLNTVYGFKLTGVNATVTDNGSTSAIANIGSSANVYTKYKLHNTVIKGIAGEGPFRVVRKISGGIFSLMGSEFTAVTAGSYSVQDGYIKAADINDGKFDFGTDVKFDGANEGSYSFNVVDDAKPVIELQGKMPTYKEIYDEEKEGGAFTLTNGLVKIPTAIAYTENGMGKIDIDIIDPDGNDDVDFDEAENTFKVTKHGVYTVTYTATYENGEKADAQYKISVGDVEAPKFTLKNGTSTSGTKQEGSVFNFKEMVLDEGEDTSGVTITKEIYDPSGELLSSSTVDGSYSGYANKKNNGSEIKLNKVGEYTIVYTAKDSVGNPYKITENVTVASKGSGTPTTWTGLSTALIIVAVILLAGVIIYVVKFRKVKK